MESNQIELERTIKPIRRKQSKGMPCIAIRGMWKETNNRDLQTPDACQKKKVQLTVQYKTPHATDVSLPKRGSTTLYTVCLREVALRGHRIPLHSEQDTWNNTQHEVSSRLAVDAQRYPTERQGHANARV